MTAGVGMGNQAVMLPPAGTVGMLQKMLSPNKMSFY